MCSDVCVCECVRSLSSQLAVDEFMLNNLNIYEYFFLRTCDCDAMDKVSIKISKKNYKANKSVELLLTYNSLCMAICQWKSLRQDIRLSHSD